MHATADDPKQQQAKVAAMGANALDLPCDIVVGTVVNGRYTVNKTLHKSTTAITYSATDNITEKQVALTALPLRGPCGSKQLELMRHEAVVMQGLAHPGIPAYMDHFVEDAASDRAFYIVQEEVQGKSLAHMVAAGMRADESQVNRIALGLLNILKYLGCLRPAVMHGDVKPENVVLGGGKWGGRVYLTCFRGVQWAAATGNLSLSSTGTAYTYGYMAPEQFTDTASPASDLYGLGATLLYLLTGLEPQLLPKHRLRITWRDRVTVSKQLGDLLDGLLEPVAKDRLTAPEAISVATGKAAGSTRSPQPGDTLPSGDLMHLSLLSAWVCLLIVKKVGWSPGMPNGSVPKLANSRVILTSTIDSFDIYIPPLGCKGIDIITALFVLAGDSFIGMCTYFAISAGNISLLLFLTPFCYFGYTITSLALDGVFTPEHLAIGHKKWRLTQGFGLLEGVGARLGWKYAKEGQTCDLSGAKVVDTGTCILVRKIEIAEGVRKFRFGGSLDPLEQDWLVYEIDTHIADLEGRGSALEDTSETDS